MLPTQVSYWANQEQKRHNMAMEAIDYGTLGVAQTNAATNIRNASTNLTNAMTNVRNAQVNERNAETNVFNAATNRTNAETNRYQAVTQREVGTAQAQAALQQASAAQRQANVAENRAVADIAYTESKTRYQDKENAWYVPKAVVEIAQGGTRALDNLGISFNTISSGARSLISAAAYNLRN